MVTEEPAGPEVGEMPVTDRFSTEKGTLLLTTPAFVTVTGPLVAPCGTETVMLVSLHVRTGLASTPLNRTWLPAPCPMVKPEPLIMTVAPTCPVGGDRLEITGWYRVNAKFPLLRIEFTTTVTEPEVALEGKRATI